jgi:hypothetical protein
MRGFFAVSYVLLWALVVIETVLLREVLRRTIWFRRFHDEFSRGSKGPVGKSLPQGSRAPEFSAPLLGTEMFLRSSDLKGNPSILLFVSAEEESPHYKNLAIAIHAWWHEKNGHVYLVCKGSEEGCRQFAHDYCSQWLEEHRLPVLLDEDGQIARSFLIEEMPQAVSLDSETRIDRYGYPSSHEEAEETETEIIHSQTAHSSSEEPAAGAAEVKHANNGREKEPCLWPEDRPYTGATFARMNTTVSCVITRFRLRSAWSLIPFYLAFRRVRRGSKEIEGLLQAVFLIEDLRTCYTMSLWKDDCAIVDFGRVGAHITAANSAFAPTYRQDLKRAEIWSAQFRLWAVSSHNLNWDGFDLKTVLTADQWEMRERVARGEFDGEEVNYG